MALGTSIRPAASAPKTAGRRVIRSSARPSWPWARDRVQCNVNAGWSAENSSTVSARSSESSSPTLRAASYSMASNLAWSWATRRACASNAVCTSAEPSRDGSTDSSMAESDAPGGISARPGGNIARSLMCSILLRATGHIQASTHRKTFTSYVERECSARLAIAASHRCRIRPLNGRMAVQYAPNAARERRSDDAFGLGETAETQHDQPGDEYEKCDRRERVEHVAGRQERFEREPEQAEQRDR